MTLCACGCGEEVIQKSKYYTCVYKGHHGNKMRKMTEESRRKQGLSLLELNKKKFKEKYGYDRPESGVCECGCGTTIVRNGRGHLNRFVKGHQRRGAKLTEEQANRLHAGLTPEVVAKRSESIRQAHKRPEVQAHSVIRGIKARQTDPLTPERIEALTKARKEWRENNPEKVRDMYESIGRKRKEGIASGRIEARSWKHGLSEERQLEARKKLSESKKRFYESLSDDDFAAYMKKCHMVSAPNKAEAKLASLLPENVVYVGDHSFWVKTPIGSKNPDFIVRPYTEKKMVIELYGDYWHKGQDPSVVVEAYNKVGVTCLVVWEHELNDQNTLRNKLDEFLAGGM